MPAANAAKPSKLPAHEVISIATDDKRWRILKALTASKSAKQIAEELDMKPALVQYHLKILLNAGMVDEFQHPDFKRRYLYTRRDLTASVQISDAKFEAKALTA